MRNPGFNYNLIQSSGIMKTFVQTRDIFICHGWENSPHIRTLTEELDKATEFDDQFAYINHGDFDKTVLVEDRLSTLEIIVKDQIKNAAVLLVMTDLYEEYNEWIDFELKLAKDLNKPVILIRSYENRKTPPHLEQRADDVVAFEPEKLLKKIKKYS